MLTHWYACTQLQVLPLETTALVDIVDCLRRGDWDPDIVDSALTSLGALDGGLQVLVIPEVVRLLSTGDLPEEVRRRAVARLEEAGGRPLPHWMTDLAVALAAGSTGQIAELIRSKFPISHRDFTGFTDLAESGPVVLRLSLIREVVRRLAADVGDTDVDEDAVDGTVEALLYGDSAEDFIEQAVDGRYGRVPQYLVADCLLMSGESAKTLLQDFGLDAPGPWTEDPGMVRLRMATELRKQRIRSDADAARWLCDEAVELKLYAECVGPPSGMGLEWLDPRNRYAEAASRLVLWQSIAWEMAVERDPRMAAEMLATSWACPAGIGDHVVVEAASTGRHMAMPLSYLAGLRYRKNKGKVTVEVVERSGTLRKTDQDALMYSPWLDRTAPRYNPEDSDAFSRISDDVAVLRMAANARTLIQLTETLLRLDEDVPDYLWDLFFNMLDAFSNKALRQVWQLIGRGERLRGGQHSSVGPAVGSLVHCAVQQAHRHAKGILDERAVESIENRLDTVRSLFGDEPTQITRLYGKFAAHATVAHEIWEAAAGELRSTGAVESPWLVGGEASPGADVLRGLFGGLWENPTSGTRIGDPGYLLKEVLPDLWQEGNEAWNWLELYEAGKVSALAVAILSPRLELAEWQRLGDLEKDPFNDASWSAILTERLIVVMTEGSVEDRPTWFEVWRDAVQSINSPQQFSRALRAKMIELLALAAKNQTEAEIQRIALEAILEFSRATLRYQDGAGVALAEALRQNPDPGVTEMLTGKWLHEMERHRAEVTTGLSPWTIRFAEATEAGRSVSSRTVLASLLDAGLADHCRHVLDDIDRATVTDLHSYAAYAGQAFRALLFHRSETSDRAVFAPSTSGAVAPGAVVDQRGTLGVVSQPQLPQLDPDPSLAINTGIGEPLRGSWADEWSVAEQVVLRNNNRSAQLLPAAPGTAGDVAEADATWQDGKLTIAPIGRSGGDAAGAVLSRWLPDARRAIESAESVRCLVTCTQDGTWAPYQAGLTRLITEIAAGTEDGNAWLTVVEEDSGRWEFQLSFGRHYEIHDGEMTVELAAALDAARVASSRNGARPLTGLRVAVIVSRDGATPVLGLAQGTAVDDRNLRWRDSIPETATAVLRDGVRVVSLFDGAEVIVDVEGAPQTSDDITVRIDRRGWTNRAQRVGHVRAAYVRRENLAVRGGLDALREYLRLAPGDTVELLDLASGAVDGHLVCRLQSGLPIAVAEDSLSLIPTTPPATLVEGRRVVVTRRGGGGLARRDAVPAQISRLSGVDTDLRGVLVARTDGKGKVKVWLDAGERDLTVEVAESTFATESGPLGSTVSAEYSAEGWVFSTESPVLFARALWRVEQGPADSDVPLSRTDVPGHGTAVVYQSTTEPVLRYGDDPNVDQAMLTAGAPYRGDVEIVRPGDAVTAQGEPLDAVVVRLGNESRAAGFAQRGAFRHPRPWSVVRLMIEQLGDDDPVRWFDARREFVPGKRRRAVRRADTPDLRVAEFAAWLEEGDEHAVAQWGQKIKADSVLLTDLAVPLDPDDSSSDFTRTVRMAHRPRALVRGCGYDPGNSRVRVVRRGREWVARFDTRPLTLREFDEQVLAEQDNPKRFRMWYAGLHEDGDHLFEWGFGWTLKLGRNEIGEPDAKMPFFGDRIGKISVTRPAHGNPQLKYLDHRWEVERLVDEDAQARVLHQVEVVISERGGRTWVDIRGIDYRNRTISDGDVETKPTRYARMFNSEFDRISAEMIIDWARRHGALEQFRVLARLDRTLMVGQGGRRKLTFTYVTSMAGSEPERRPQQGESLVLVGRDIKPNRTRNDFTIGFKVGDELDEAVDFDVTVQRRAFSARESVLRQAHRNSPETFRGVPMLVKLIEDRGRDGWRGSVVDAPPRPGPRLLNWAEKKPGAAYVTVVRHRRHHDQNGFDVWVEAEPGVIAKLRVPRRPPTSGSLCRLDLDGGKPVLTVVVPGDHTYIPREGRAVQLMMKDGRGGFSVAGLPGAALIDEGMWNRLRGTMPPRLGGVRSVGNTLAFDANVTVRAGKLKLGPRDHEYPVRPEVAPVSKRWPVDRHRWQWAELSYRDDTPRSLAEHTLRGRWRYHDRTTRYFHHGSNEWRSFEYRDPVTSKDGPLFFDPQWRLRYRAEELAKYGYSVQEALEYGLPQNDEWYPVAAPVSRGGARGLWIELSPGRVVEFGASILHSPATQRSALDGMDWRLFSSGDEVRLAARRDRRGAITSFRLVDWRPGGRGFFGDSRALLVPSVKRRSNGGISRVDLGRGIASLTWSNNQGLGDNARWLTPDNVLSTYRGGISVDDVVVLVPGADGVRIDGGDGVDVVFAEHWGDHDWVREALVGDASTQLFAVLGGGVPVSVTAVDDDRVTVAARWRRPRGRILSARVLSHWIDDQVIVRSGATVLRMPARDLLPGAPDEERTELVRALVRTREQVWLRSSEGRWMSPALTGPFTGTASMTPVCSGRTGLVVQCATDLGLYWLPLAELGFAPENLQSAAAEYITRRGRAIEAVVGTAPGQVSHHRTSAGKTAVRRVRSGESLQVEPVRLLSSATRGFWLYLAVVCQADTVIALRSESELKLDEIVVVEIEGQSMPIALPRGEGRTRLQLSSWLLSLLRTERSKRGLDFAAIGAASAERMRRFQNVVGEPDTAETAGERIVAAYASRVKAGAAVTDRALRDWLNGPGGAFLSGRMTDDETSDEADYDLAPHLAGLLLLAEYGRSSDLSLASELAVHATHVLGTMAVGAEHQEILLRNWLVRNGSDIRHAGWKRLDRLDLGGRTRQTGARPNHEDPYVAGGASPAQLFDGALNGSQVTQLRYCCYGLLSRREEPDARLKSTARALLFAAGEVPEVDALCRDAEGTRLADLARLGRALSPGTGVHVSQRRLTHWQSEELKRMYAACFEDVPLSLLPQNSPRLPARLVDWATEAVAEIVAALPDEPVAGSPIPT